MEKDEVLKLISDVESKVFFSMDLVQLFRKDGFSYVDRFGFLLEDVVWSLVVCGMMGEVCVVYVFGLLYKFGEQDFVLFFDLDGVSEYIFFKGGVWKGLGLQIKCFDMFQDVGGLGRMDFVFVLEFEKLDFLLIFVVEVVFEVQEVVSIFEIKMKSCLVILKFGSCDGESLLMFLDQFCGLGYDVFGQEDYVDGLYFFEENFVVDCGFMMFSLE